MVCRARLEIKGKGHVIEASCLEDALERVNSKLAETEVR